MPSTWSPLIASSVTFCWTRIDACRAWLTAVTGKLQGEPGQVAGLLDGGRDESGGDAHRQRQRRCHAPIIPSRRARQPGSGLARRGRRRPPVPWSHVRTSGPSRPGNSAGKRVLLAAPRGYCAGVDRAVEAVEQALEQHGAPVYVRKQIVHNRHVVETLEERGAIFVDDTDEVPEGALLVVFSAHGVSPAVRAEARDRELRTIDATCPLVTKVHQEAKRFAREDFDILLVGHAGHEEVEGTAGEAPSHIQLVETAADVDAVTVRDPEKVVWLSQTTLSVDETMDTVRALRERFPTLQNPPSDDICYATQNRQVAVKAMAPHCDLVIVVGSRNSSNSVRLVEVALTAGAGAAHLVDYAREIDEDAGSTACGPSASPAAPGAGGAGPRGARPPRRARLGERRGGHDRRGVAGLLAAPASCASSLRCPASRWTMSRQAGPDASTTPVVTAIVGKLFTSGAATDRAAVSVPLAPSPISTMAGTATASSSGGATTGPNRLRRRTQVTARTQPQK